MLSTRSEFPWDDKYCAVDETTTVSGWVLGRKLVRCHWNDEKILYSLIPCTDGVDDRGTGSVFVSSNVVLIKADASPLRISVFNNGSSFTSKPLVVSTSLGGEDDEMVSSDSAGEGSGTLKSSAWAPTNRCDPRKFRLLNPLSTDAGRLARDDKPGKRENEFVIHNVSFSKQESRCPNCSLPNIIIKCLKIIFLQPLSRHLRQMYSRDLGNQPSTSHWVSTVNVATEIQLVSKSYIANCVYADSTFTIVYCSLGISRI